MTIFAVDKGFIYTELITTFMGALVAHVFFDEK